MIAEGRRIALELRVPWCLYQRKTREASLRLRVLGRERWRWWHVIAHVPQHYGGGDADRGGRIGSLTLEVKSWLSDLSLIGNLRHKAFLRVQIKAGAGGRPKVGHGCEVLGPRGQRCTWQRGHVAMRIRWTHPRRQQVTGGGIWPHSWAVPMVSVRDFEIEQQPRRPPRRAR